MTEEELTEWEHRSDVIKVLTSYEMGAWLHRRDKRLLQEIRAEIAEAFIKHGLSNTEICFDVLQIIDREGKQHD